MQAIPVHPIVAYGLLFFSVAFMGIGVWAGYYIYKNWKYDFLIFIDRSERFEVVRAQLRYQDTFTYKNKKYFLTDGAGILNRKGRAMYIFSENKPQPMRITYNKHGWLDAESLLATINNKLIQKLVQPSSKALDTLLIFGAVGGILAGIASAMILLKQFGAI